MLFRPREVKEMEEEDQEDKERKVKKIDGRSRFPQMLTLSSEIPAPMNLLTPIYSDHSELDLTISPTHHQNPHPPQFSPPHLPCLTIYPNFSSHFYRPLRAMDHPRITQINSISPPPCLPFQDQHFSKPDRTDPHQHDQASLRPVHQANLHSTPPCTLLNPHRHGPFLYSQSPRPKTPHLRHSDPLDR